MEKRKDINQSGKYVIIDICIIYSLVVREIRVLEIQQVARWDVTKGRVEFYQHVQRENLLPRSISLQRGSKMLTLSTDENRYRVKQSKFCTN